MNSTSLRRTTTPRRRLAAIALATALGAGVIGATAGAPAASAMPRQQMCWYHGYFLEGGVWYLGWFKEAC